MRDLLKAFPNVDYFDKEDLIQSMQDIYAEYETQFVIVIDEWDAIFRGYKDDKDGQKLYKEIIRKDSSITREI